MDTQRIAVAVDFSPESDLAVRHAIDLARANGAEILLVHAIDLPDPPAPIPLATLRPELARALESRQRHGERAADRDREQLAGLCRILVEQGVRVVTHLVQGHPDLAVTDAARELGADLVVLGTHGQDGLRWFPLGSVAERIIRRSDTDVLVARRDGSARDGFYRILVATDFSPTAARALERALSLATSDSVIDVVHFAPASGGKELEEMLVADLRSAGELLVSTRASCNRPRFSVVTERPVPGIMGRLESARYDLVALGSHGRRGVERFFVGSVAEAIARRAPCSVLIAKAGLTR